MTNLVQWSLLARCFLALSFCLFTLEGTAFGQSPSDPPAPAPAEVAPSAPAAADLSPSAAAKAAPTSSEALPVLVIPVPGKGLTEALANATLDAVVSELRVMVKGRAVRPITDPNVITANLACTEPACHGRIIADLNGIQGLLVSMAQPSPKKPASVVLSLLSAVDGTVNGEVQNIEIPLEQISTPLELIRAGLVALKPVLPARPAVGSLLIATSADGASISVDGKPVGTSPMAPIDVAPGTHVVSVTQPGFTTYSRSVEVTVDGARVDADLQPDAGEMKRIEDAEKAAAAANAPPKPWFKRWYVWAAAGAALVLGAVIIGVAASSGGQEPFVVPPINP